MLGQALLKQRISWLWLIMGFLLKRYDGEIDFKKLTNFYMANFVMKLIFGDSIIT